MVVNGMNCLYKRLFELVQASCHQLEHLQFSYLGRKSSWDVISWFKTNKTNLQLANLRTFYSQGDDLPCGLHLPQLTELCVYSKLSIRATDDQTKLCIQRLRTLLVYQLSYPPGFEFSNLEVFYFNEPSFSISLRDFPRLKEIHYFELSWSISHWIYDLKNLLEQKRILERNQLRFYFDGFELNARTDFELLDYLDYKEGPNLSRFRCKLNLNEKILRLIKETPWRLKFNLLSKNLMISHGLYDELISLPEGDEHVRSMFKSAQYINFESDLKSSIECFIFKKEPVNLFKLSDRFRYVWSASVSTGLSQSLLDQLPDAFPHLVEFSYDRKFVVCIPNFQFIGRFKSLHHFHVDPQLLSTDELRFIFENCKFINHVEFRKSNITIKLCRSFGCKSYQAEWNLGGSAIPFASATFSVEGLLNYFEASKWVEKNDRKIGWV